MNKVKDRTGIHYGRLMVVEFAYQDLNGIAYWKCKCDCGNEKIISGNHLQDDSTKSCGCLHREIKNLAGQRFGRLLVIKLAYQNRRGATFWLCRCDCGNKKIIKGNSLKRGTKSCGCLHVERNKRQTNENHPNYKDGKTTKKIHNLKEKIRKRDKICQECGKTQKEEGCKLSVHHIDEDDTNNDLDNLITLCNSCHKKIK